MKKTYSEFKKHQTAKKKQNKTEEKMTEVVA